MPSPYAGMDPYLEGSEWMSFHSEFCVEIARQIRPLLRPKYTAMTMKYYVMDTPDEVNIATFPLNRSGIYADVGVSETRLEPSPSQAPLTIMAPSLEMETFIPEPVPQLTVEIRDVAERKLVTLIELLSPANKRGQGYDEYVNKRYRVLLNTAHLLEIDLLRKGKRIPMRQSLPDTPYFVFLSCAQRRPRTEVWTIALEQPLPIVPIPLLAEGDDIPLDLQQAFDNVYDTIGYDLIIDYDRPPDIPL